MTWNSTMRKHQEKDSLGEGRALGVGVRAKGSSGVRVWGHHGTARSLKPGK